tara:strand:- start:191 stop:385 length:195 start_codon:yes stop_codon:yes gene_type:complete
MTVVNLSENQQEIHKDPYQFYSTEFIYHKKKDKGNKTKMILSSMTLLIIGYGLGIVTCKLIHFC